MLIQDKGLLQAVQDGSLEKVEQYLKEGADVHARDNQERTALYWAAQWGSSTKVIQCLLKHGADVHARDDQERTALHEAAEHCEVESIHYLCTQGADIQCADVNGKTPLYCFVKYYQDKNIKEAQVESVVETIRLFLVRGDFLFYPLKIRELDDNVFQSVTIYDCLPLTLQLPVKVCYEGLIAPVLAEHPQLNTRVLALKQQGKDETFCYTLVEQFIAAKRALPGLIASETLKISVIQKTLSHFADELLLQISEALLIQWKIKVDIAPLLAEVLLEQLRAKVSKKHTTPSLMNLSIR